MTRSQDKAFNLGPAPPNSDCAFAPVVKVDPKPQVPPNEVPQPPAPAGLVSGHPVPAPPLPFPPDRSYTVPEPTPAANRRVCGCSRKLSIVLAIVAVLLVAGLALGLGLGLGLNSKSGGGASSDGAMCSAAADCVNNCIAGTCTSLRPDQAPCTEHSQCYSRKCGVQNNTCLFSSGHSCDGNNFQCATRCLNNICA